MGEYIINGEVIDIREPQVTGALVKSASGNPLNDWVMASMPGGQVVRVADSQTIPHNAESLSVVPAYEYGLE